jgi:hypothetical protein
MLHDRRAKYSLTRREWWLAVMLASLLAWVSLVKVTFKLVDFFGSFRVSL